MGRARRRPSGSRRRRGGPSAGGVAVRLTAAAAVGLVALSAPATELAARVTASAAPVRAAAPADPPAPATPADPVAPATVAPAPVAELPVTAPPRRLQVELPTPVVPRGQPLQVTPPPAECGGYGNPRQVTPGVVPGAGSATVSWQADGRDDVRGYRVTAVSQALTPGGQPAPPRVDVAQRADCGEVSTVLGGLTPGVPYVFWLEEALLDADTQVVEYVQVGWSSPVVVG
ncbi:hypothetical protein [Geodermatophilus sp. SYSU D00766]